MSVLCCYDYNAIGSLRAVDGCGCGITQNVYRLDVVGSYKREVDAWNTVDYIVRLHSCTGA